MARLRLIPLALGIALAGCSDPNGPQLGLGFGFGFGTNGVTVHPRVTTRVGAASVGVSPGGASVGTTVGGIGLGAAL